MLKKIAAALLLLPLFVCSIPVFVFSYIGEILADAICWLVKEKKGS